MRTNHFATEKRIIPLKEVGLVFGYIGLFSIGGGLAAWVYRETVEKRKWVSDTQFFSGLALAQIMPGTNIMNLAIYLGYALRGIIGACVAFLSFSALPTIVLTTLYVITSRFQHMPLVQFTLGGVAAAAVGLSVATGIKVLHRSSRTIAWVIAGLIVVASTVFRTPTLVIFISVAPISVFLAFKGYYD